MTEQQHFYSLFKDLFAGKKNWSHFLCRYMPKTLPINVYITNQSINQSINQSSINHSINQSNVSFVHTRHCPGKLRGF